MDFVAKFAMINARINLSHLILQCEIYFDQTSEDLRPHFSVLFCFYEIDINFIVLYDIKMQQTAFAVFVSI